ncbi:MAG: hypothetical protein ISR65_07950 [Bacteriovoracaceae bacterium]|nr:hypothetical protein [Bacteriovoracaceae bacterium]
MGTNDHFDNEIVHTFNIIYKWKWAILIFAIITTSISYLSIGSDKKASTIIKVGTIAGEKVSDHFSITRYLHQEFKRGTFSDLNFGELNALSFQFNNFSVVRNSEKALNVLFTLEYQAHSAHKSLKGLSQILNILMTHLRSEYQAAFDKVQSNINAIKTKSVIPIRYLSRPDNVGPQVIFKPKIQNSRINVPKKIVIIFIVSLFFGIFISLTIEYLLNILKNHSSQNT